VPSVALLCSMAVLAAVLIGVIRSPGQRSEAVWAVPGALLVVAVGLVPLHVALTTMRHLAPTLAFLAAMFVIAHVADRAGLFDVAAAFLRRAGGRGMGALLAAVAVTAVLVTTVLSLDATAVLFTPIVVAATRHRTDRNQALLATAFLANGASLLLPVANLTNLLAIDQLGLSFPAFAARMALPTVTAAVVITVGCRVLAPAADVSGLVSGSGQPLAEPDLEPGPERGGGWSTDARWVAVGLGGLLVAFVVASLDHIGPAPVAVVGAAALAIVAVTRGLTGPRAVARAVDPAFLAFVAALGVVVAAPARHGLTSAVADRLPAGTGLLALLAVAFGAALLANLVTNLPATLVLLPAIGAHRPAFLLAALIGVNVGPNLTVTGSLATLLWRKIVRRDHVEPTTGAFFRVTLVTTPIALATATVALWLSLQVV